MFKDQEQLSIQRLEEKGIHPTAIRLLVLERMMQEQRAVSIPELEVMLDTVDKSSIFRTLTLFLKHDLIHAIEDGSGALKYEICEGMHECTIEDMHPHFYCESCHRTFCLKEIPVPSIELPEDFHMHFVNYMVKGICKDCAEHHRIHG